MSDVKYEVVADEEIAVTGVKAFPESTSKKRSLCKSLFKFFLLLSLAVVIVFTVLAAAVFYCGHHLMHKVGETIVPQLTTDHPLDLPMVRLPKSEIHDIKHRLDEFHHALHHGETPKNDLVLTERDINGLICSDDDEMCGHAYATIMENMISADFSFPAEDAPGGKGRYFVGTKSLLAVPHDSSSYSMQGTVTARGPQGAFTLLNTTWYVDLDNVNVQIESAEVLGWMATDAFVQHFFKGKNWADHMCPHARKSLEHIKGVSIGDKKIVVHVK